jgi:hypothetical protein
MKQRLKVKHWIKGEELFSLRRLIKEEVDCLRAKDIFIKP